MVFEVLSPYVIVPLVGDLHDREDDREASIVTFDSRGRVKVAISLDYGRSFRSLATAESAGKSSLDLTPYLRERYQYLIKFILEGAIGETVLETLRIRTWVQVAPASLPRLKKGVNHLRYKIEDKHGLPTLPWLQIPNMGSAEEMNRYWASPSQDFDPGRYQERLKGEGELSFPAPPGRKIVWLSLGGFFSSHRGARAVETENQIWYQPADSTEWRLAHTSEVPEWHSHWHYAFDR
jgi:hypothetical protein